MPGSLEICIRSRHPTRELMDLKKTLFILSAIATGMRIYIGTQQNQKTPQSRQLRRGEGMFPFTLCLDGRSSFIRPYSATVQISLAM